MVVMLSRTVVSVHRALCLVAGRNPARQVIRQTGQAASGLAEEAVEMLRESGFVFAADGLNRSQPYGLKRLLGVLIAVGTNPKILLLDEPSAGMNPSEIVVLTKLLLCLNRNRGMGMVVVEHDMRSIMQLCERMVVLHHGKKISEGSPGQAASDPVVIEACLGRGQEPAPVGASEVGEENASGRRLRA
jgi:ABC-type branched-subunit amino acid transport system ATPase component